MRLLGFTPTKKMIEQAQSLADRKQTVVENLPIDTRPVPIVEYTERIKPIQRVEPVQPVERIESVELPVYVTPIKTQSVLPSKKKSSSQLKRKVTSEPIETAEVIVDVPTVESPLAETVEPVEPVEPVELVEPVKPVETVEVVDVVEPVKPVYTKPVKTALPPILPTKKKPSSQLKRKVTLNPLSN